MSIGGEFVAAMLIVGSGCWDFWENVCVVSSSSSSRNNKSSSVKSERS